MSPVVSRAPRRFIDGLEVDLLRDVGKPDQQTLQGVLRRLSEAIEEVQRRGA